MIERQDKIELVCNQSEKMLEETRDFSRSTGKLVEKVGFMMDNFGTLFCVCSIKRKSGSSFETRTHTHILYSVTYYDNKNSTPFMQDLIGKYQMP